MFRVFVNWYAKRRYVFKQEFESSVAELSAKAALKRAADTHDLVARMTKEADELDARIKHFAEMEENGFWECEDGHEEKASMFRYVNGPEDERDFCVHENCTKLTKHIRRDLMSGKDIYESDKQRAEVEKIAGNNRAAIAEQEAEVKNQEDTAKVFMNQANRGRAFADLLRKL